jgi:diguanylate cyclase (GGDEF)-like protein
MRLPRRMSVRTATGLLIVAIAVALAVVAYATMSANTQHHNAQAQAERAITNSAHLEDALGAAYDEWVTIMSLFVLRDPSYRARFDESRATVDEALTALRNDAVANDPGEVATIDGYIATHQSFTAVDEQVIDAIARGDLTTALSLSNDSKLTLDAGRFLGELQARLAGQRDQISAAQRNQRQAQSTTVRWSMGIGSLTALLLIAAGAASYWWIARPLQRTSAATRAIAAGDSSARAARGGPRELADLADDVNSMADALMARSAEINLYLSRNLESRTAELERANADLAREVDVRAQAEADLARTLAAERELEKQLRHQAFHDPLTGIANRARFMDRLDHALERVRGAGAELFVLFLDLDNFKTINDSMGHPVGDGTICEVANRISACLRPGDTAARLGGDEFAILLEGARDLDGAAQAARRLIEAVRAPMIFDGREVVISASVGLAAGDARTLSEDLVRNADIAMYVAKSRGKGRYEVYEPGMHARLTDRLALMMDLRHAVRRGEIVVHYQPTLSLAAGSVCGAEALVRWRHPARGLLAPLDFIALAEESGDILEIGEFVLREACQRASAWQDLYPDERLLIGVNVSAKQLRDGGFVESVRGALAYSRLEPARLELEITESVMLDEPDQTLAVLEQLKQLGVRVALDDFGTGYSSLSYLRRFPIDVLKIDKSFVDDIASEDRQVLLTKAIIELGQSLNLKVIAEGIERDEQRERLRALNCELGQGFLFSTPLEPAAIDEYFASALRPPHTEAA